MLKHDIYIVHIYFNIVNVSIILSMIDRIGLVDFSMIDNNFCPIKKPYNQLTTVLYNRVKQESLKKAQELQARFN
jgi:hypothetical protein